MGRGESSRTTHDHHRGRGRGRVRRHTFNAEGFRRKFEEAHYAPGGTKDDPLNLNGMQEEPEESDGANSEPDEVFVPKDVRDPLGLRTIKKEKRKRGVKEHRSRSNSPIPAKMKKGNSTDGGSLPAETESKKSEAVDPAKDGAKAEEQETRKSKKQYFNQKYIYGNFDRYYGARLDHGQKDSRLEVLQKEWFEKKTVLDIGCNVGFVTLAIAKEYGPRRILGIDIDEHLVGVARKNIRHYCDHDIQLSGKFPASFCNQFGPVSTLPTTFKTKFPDNVWFRKENFVLEKDEFLEQVKEEFDVILALSVTKWIHLNWGDDGMRRFFIRAFKQLRPGGRFILEPQAFSTYKKRSSMSDVHRENYARIEFKPADFEMYLLETVGFDRVEHLDAPPAKTKGFQRPIDVYVKGTSNQPKPVDHGAGPYLCGPNRTTPHSTTDSPVVGRVAAEFVSTATPSSGAEASEISPMYQNT